MSVSLSEFLDVPGMRAELPGCSDPSMERQILLAARMFCKKTWIWSETESLAIAPANLATVELDPPVIGSQIEAVRIFYHNGMPVTPKAEVELDRANPRWRALTGSQIRHFIGGINGAIRIIPIQTENATITDIKMILVPTLAATSLPDMLYDEYGEAITAGAKAALMMQPKQVWTDYGRGQMLHGVYEEAISEAKIRVAHSFAPSERTMSVQKLPGTR